MVRYSKLLLFGFVVALFIYGVGPQTRWISDHDQSLRTVLTLSTIGLIGLFWPRARTIDVPGKPVSLGRRVAAFLLDGCFMGAIITPPTLVIQSLIMERVTGRWNMSPPPINEPWHWVLHLSIMLMNAFILYR